MGFKETIEGTLGRPLSASGVHILQANLGYRCNMACTHCHVEGRPDRGQSMDRQTVDAVLGAVAKKAVATLDITGGAPELNPHFRYMVDEAVKMGIQVIVRTNLTIFFEKGFEDLPEFYADRSVEVVASLPHYSEYDVDLVRGKGAFAKSIKALQRLNALGYGGASGDKKLNLVYNPAGPFLSPPQNALDCDYKKELGGRYGIAFGDLYTFTNMPIGRFREYLLRTGGLERYMHTLACSFNPETVSGLMCRQSVSVGWDGRLHDCDFNQLLGLPVQSGCPQEIGEFDPSCLAERTITVGDHCYGCTAGQGST